MDKSRKIKVIGYRQKLKCARNAKSITYPVEAFTKPRCNKKKDNGHGMGENT
jgi:hypothetical protein